MLSLSTPPHKKGAPPTWNAAARWSASEAAQILRGAGMIAHQIDLPPICRRARPADVSAGEGSIRHIGQFGSDLRYPAALADTERCATIREATARQGRRFGCCPRKVSRGSGMIASGMSQGCYWSSTVCDRHRLPLRISVSIRPGVLGTRVLGAARSAWPSQFASVSWP
jgi:hypothetical protein